MSMRTSVTGLNASQTQLSTIANNIANASTTGFKASRVEFGDVFAADSSRVTPGAGVRVTNISQMMNQGGLEFSGNALDLAIKGNGYFELKDTGGNFTYTRSGNFSLDKEGYLVSANGARVQKSGGGDIQINMADADGTGLRTLPVARYEIDADGKVQTYDTEGNINTIATIGLATFAAPQRLAQVGDTSWRATSESGAAQVGTPGSATRGTLESGALEASNVDIAEQLVDMITAQRNFQANAKSITTFDAIAQSIINIR